MILVSAQAFPPATGGIENLLQGTALHAALAGHRVHVLADGGAAARAHDAATETPYTISRFTGPRPLRRWLKARALLALAREAAAGGTPVEALFLDSWKSLEPLPTGLPFPVIAWAHGNEFPSGGPKVARIGRALARASHLLINSRDTEARIGAAMPPGTPRTILHPPVFPSTEPTADDTAETEALWQGADLRLLSLCRLIAWKGVDTAIRAMPAILAAHPGARFVIAGDGDDRARLAALTRDLGIADAVTFAGWRQGGAKTALMRTATLMLQPGRRIGDEREGYGISYVEAALEGLPTVSGNAGGAPEAVIDGKTGLVIHANETQGPANLADAVVALLAEPRRLAEMQAAARTHGQANLWPNRIAALLATAGLTPKA